MLNLTRQEAKVILFLVCLALFGAGVNFAAKIYLPLKRLISVNADTGVLELNSADKDSLMDIPGIGERLAGRIVEYREKVGAFGDVEELKNIKGLSGKKFEKIKGYLSVKESR